MPVRDRGKEKSIQRRRLSSFIGIWFIGNQEVTRDDWRRSLGVALWEELLMSMQVCDRGKEKSV